MTTMEQMVEAGARAFAEHNGWDFDNMPGRARTQYLGAATAAIRAALPILEARLTVSLKDGLEALTDHQADTIGIRGYISAREVVKSRLSEIMEGK